MMQLIFLAVLCGIATGLIGDYSATLKDLFEALNELFLEENRQFRKNALLLIMRKQG